MSITSRTIVIATLIMFLLSSLFLFVWEKKNREPDYKKSWSSVYFVNPSDRSAKFAIENHEGKDYEYGIKILSGDKVLHQSDIFVKAGAKKVIDPGVDGQDIDLTVKVSVNQKDYEIAKKI